MHERIYGEAMTWWEYVARTAAGEEQAAIAKRVGLGQSMISRWKVGRPVLEAFIAAGFLTPEEASEIPSAPPSLASLDDDDLLAEVRRRMQGGQSDAGNAEAEKIPLTERDEVALAADDERHDAGPEGGGL